MIPTDIQTFQDAEQQWNNGRNSLLIILALLATIGFCEWVWG